MLYSGTAGVCISETLLNSSHSSSMIYIYGSAQCLLSQAAPGHRCSVLKDEETVHVTLTSLHEHHSMNITSTMEQACMRVVLISPNIAKFNTVTS